MKIIEALKKTKHLQSKLDDLKNKIAMHSAYLSFETPAYENQKEQVEEWLQSYHDTVKEISRLRIAVQKTNILTNVQIEIDGVIVSKSIAEWIHRRKDLAALEKISWGVLTDRNLKEGTANNSSGQPFEVKIVRCYDPKKRDKMISIYSEEPSLVDAHLEIVNAITDLIE